jgi:hypothetical protein
MLLTSNVKLGQNLFTEQNTLAYFAVVSLQNKASYRNKNNISL